MWIASWLPHVIRPLPPGVLIAVLAFLAAVVTFREPTPWEKRAWILIFGLLIVGEVWMITKDRDAHDLSEAKARVNEREHFDSARASEQAHFDSTTAQLSQTLSYTNQILQLQDKARRAEENHATEQLKEIRHQQDAVSKLAADASKALVLSLAPNVIAQIDAWLIQWQDEDKAWRGKMPLGRGAPEYIAQIPIMQEKYAGKIHPTMVAARSIQQQLLSLLGRSGGYDGIDRAASGQLIRLDELRTSGQYLTNLVNRVQAQSQPKE
jgi:hypothetical protein